MLTVTVGDGIHSVSLCRLLLGYLLQ